MGGIDPRDMDIILEMRQGNEADAAGQDEGLRYELASVRELTLPARGRDIPVIVYTPRVMPGEALPAFINIHGGGFVMARARMDAPYCRRVAAGARCVVVNVDYRLAPEHPYPAALNDCYDAALWVRDHAGELGVDASRVAIGGYSAGANLSAAVCLRARDEGAPPICYQVLCYAPMDLTGGTPAPEGTDAFPKEVEALFNRSYLGADGDPRDPLVSPALAGDVSGLPPALVVVGEKDGLRASSERYADMLRGAGVPVRYEVYPGVGHGFTHSACPEADAAWELICASLRDAFGGGLH